MLKANEALGLSNSADVNLYQNRKDIFDYFFEKIERKIRERCLHGRRFLCIESYDIYDDSKIRNFPSAMRLHMAQIIIQELLRNGYSVNYSETSSEFTIHW